MHGCKCMVGSAWLKVHGWKWAVRSGTGSGKCEVVQEVGSGFINQPTKAPQ